MHINFVVRMRLFSLTLDTIRILCLVYSNFCSNEKIFKSTSDLLLTVNIILLAQKF